jgi:sialic acid synthase SpsE
MAAQQGAVVVEKHFTITPGEGSDHDFAITTKQAAWIVSHMNPPVGSTVKAAIGSGRIGVFPAEEDARRLARRSIHTRVPIRKGSQITEEMLMCVRPGTGLPPVEVDRVCGRVDGAAWRAQVDIPAGVMLERRMVGHMGATLTVF